MKLSFKSGGVSTLRDFASASQFGAEISVGITLVGRLRAQLFLWRQVEESLCFRPSGVDHSLRDTVVLDRQETGAATDVVDLAAERLLPCGARGLELSEIEHGK